MKINQKLCQIKNENKKILFNKIYLKFNKLF